jgi:hypothetical protein
MRIMVRWTVGMVLLGCVVSTVRADDDKYLVDTGEGKKQLRHELVLQEEQDGFLGRRGTLWRIKPEGEWDVVQFEVEHAKIKEIESTRRKGKLCPQQLVQLGQKLNDEGFKTLPEHLGEPASVNSHRYKLIFGESKRIDGVITRRGESIRENIVQGSPPMGSEEEVRERDRFAKVADSVASATERKKSD